MSKIPEGATHKNAFGFFCKYHAGVWYSYADGDWIRFIDAELETYIPIQAEPEWSGEGLPPVGTICESMWNEAADKWLKAKVFGSNEHGQPIFRWEEGSKKYEYQASPLSGHRGNPYFRTIRTPEQIAAEKRDAAIKEMQRLVGSCNTFPFADLYDYGYRLQVEK